MELETFRTMRKVKIVGSNSKRIVDTHERDKEEGVRSQARKRIW